ncbi:MAG: hypothetical protein DYG89_13770, partial [Caldilinea sp. CFX5]|nr:hypothetical protein [Caldilinea sp. CFX5]
MTDVAHETRRRSPYQGLEPYTEADYAYFFGRDQEITTLTANLGVARLTLLYGPSGVGKSSVLRAGVIHRLQQQARANQVAYGRPEIIPVYFNSWQGEALFGLTKQIHRTTSALYAGVPNAPDLQMYPHQPFPTLLAQIGEQTQSDLLIVLDQFEEYFLYHPNETGLGSFAHHFIQAVNSSHLRANFLLSLREDALARLDYFKGRIPFLLDNRLSIGHLDRTAGHEAVVKPLDRFNQDQQTAYDIEPLLVAAVLDQVGSGQVTLSKQGVGGRSETNADRIEAPYLQLVLTELWKQEGYIGSTCLRKSTLDALHGAATIVRDYLNGTLAKLSLDEQYLAARFFDRLVTPSGAKIALSLVELAYYTGSDVASLAAVIEQLQSKRLLRAVTSPAGDTQYEIFHDVLGPALLDWQVHYQKTKRLNEEQSARTAAEQREREAQAQAATEQHHSRRLRLLLGVIVVLFLGAVSLAGFVWTARQDAITKEQAAATAQAEAERALRRALAENLAGQTQLLIRRDQSFGNQSLILARDAMLTTLAVDGYTTANAYTALRTVVEGPAWRYTIPPANQRHEGPVYSVAFSPDHQRVVSGSTDGTIRLWRLPHLTPLTILFGHTGSVWSVAFSPDGQQIVSGSDDRSIRLWDAQTGQQLTQFVGHTDSVLAVAFSPDGRYIVSGSADKSIRLWDVNNRQ